VDPVVPDVVNISTSCIVFTITEEIFNVGGIVFSVSVFDVGVAITIDTDIAVIVLI